MERPPALLASDMDGTVIPLELTLEREREIATLKGSVEDAPELILAYVTGRDLPLALKGIRDHRLPEPAILVCDVGTSVYHRTPSGFVADGGYQRLMEEASGGLDVREARHRMARVPGLILQPEDRQTKVKLSYYLPPNSDHQEVLVSVHRVLEDLGGRLQAVYSVGAPHGRGLLDLLPAGVAKDFAIRYLHDHTAVAPERVVYAGDSGNDLAAMLCGYRVIVVGNATPDLRRELLVRGREMGLLDLVYFADDFYAAGVMEGCRHFGIF